MGTGADFSYMPPQTFDFTHHHHTYDNTNYDLNNHHHNHHHTYDNTNYDFNTNHHHNHHHHHNNDNNNNDNTNNNNDLPDFNYEPP
jgi:hypothetical protein